MGIRNIVIKFWHCEHVKQLQLLLLRSDWLPPLWLSVVFILQLLIFEFEYYTNGMCMGEY